MYAIILIYALYFVANGKFGHVSARMMNPEKLSGHDIHITQKSNNRTSCNGTDKCELQKPSKNVSINSTSLPHTQVHNSTVAPHVSTTTHQKISQNDTNPLDSMIISFKNLTGHDIHITQKSNNRTSCNGTDKCELQKPSKNVSINSTSLPHTQVHNSTVAPHVSTTTHQKISQNDTITHVTKSTPVAPSKTIHTTPKSFLKKVGDGFFDLFSEQEFHPINQKSYLFNFWYLFRSSFLNLKNMKTLLLGS
ncbi:unnamed protein product [Schistosoma spindalis]|nr:unnamed protein product [Schistosoma spindale]